MINAETLHDNAVVLANHLAAVALEAGFEVEACVTPVEPAWDCGRIHVWPAQIATVQQKCVAMPMVSLAWAVAYCIGADEQETCTWWQTDGRTENAMKLLWGVYGGLLDRYMNGSLCEDLDTKCDLVTIGPVIPNLGADLVVYSALLTYRIGLEQVVGS